MSEGIDAPIDSVPTRYRVWDAPTRLFHWALVALIVAQYLSGEFHLLGMRWHYWLGYATLALLLFRVLWGFFGSQTSRFGEFVRHPLAVLRYLFASAKDTTHVGHNPVGGWSVLALLASCLLQAISGLMSGDDIDEFGPLCAKVSEAWVARMSSIHAWNRYVLLALIGGHVMAVLFYLLHRRDNLIAPMLHGKKRLDVDPALRFAGLWRALLLLVVSAGAVVGLIAWATAA